MHTYQVSTLTNNIATGSKSKIDQDLGPLVWLCLRSDLDSDCFINMYSQT